MKSKKFRWGLLIGLFVLLVTVVACSASASPASCAFVSGDGRDGGDAKLHKVIYPGQKVVYDLDDEVITYVPCNSRNYIINDGTRKNANGETIGDRAILIDATTSTGVPIKIAAHALWTLNQDPVAMQKFYSLCLKYNCASTEDIGGGANYSTPGWNGMLGENFSYAMDTSARLAAFQASDDIWQKHDPNEYQKLGDEMSAIFASVMRANLGYTEDIFCGSGNSDWPDPNNPGEGEFHCSAVRIVVDDVQRGEVRADDSTEGVRTINEQRLKNAEALYGDQASYWLGLQDTIQACRDAQVACVVNIGGTPVSIPAPSNSVAEPQPQPSE